MTWALRQPIPSSTAKFVLVVLANCANAEQAHAWPTIAYLTAATSQDRKTVMSNLKRLQEWGFIEDTGKRVGQTKQVPVWRVICGGDLFAEGAQKRNGTENGTVPKSDGKGTEFPGKGPKNGTRNIKQPSRTETHARQPARFDEWWDEYPKHVSRKRCAQAWAERGLDARADELVKDVRNRKANCARWNAGFAPDPLTYIEDERWTDQVHAAAAPTEIPRGTPQAAPPPAKPTESRESRLENELEHIRHLHRLGAFGEGEAAAAERDRRMQAAREKHRTPEQHEACA